MTPADISELRRLLLEYQDAARARFEKHSPSDAVRAYWWRGKSLEVFDVLGGIVDLEKEAPG